MKVCPTCRQTVRYKVGDPFLCAVIPEDFPEELSVYRFESGAHIIAVARRGWYSRTKVDLKIDNLISVTLI